MAQRAALRPILEVCTREISYGGGGGGVVRKGHVRCRGQPVRLFVTIWTRQNGGLVRDTGRGMKQRQRGWSKRSVNRIPEGTGRHTGGRMNPERSGVEWRGVG